MKAIWMWAEGVVAATQRPWLSLIATAVLCVGVASAAATIGREVGHAEATRFRVDLGNGRVGRGADLDEAMANAQDPPLRVVIERIK